MRKILTAAALGLAATHAAHADVVLQDFSGITYSSPAFSAGAKYSTMLVSPPSAPALGYFYETPYSGAGSVTVGSGQLTLNTAAPGTYLSLYFGQNATDTIGHFAGISSTVMNADWSGLTGIKVNVTGLTGVSHVEVDFMNLTSWNPSLTTSNATYGQPFSPITGTGSFIIPISSLSFTGGTGVNLADVDTFLMRFYMVPVTGQTASMTIDSLELVGVTAAVPEPATGLLAAIGAGVVLMRRRRC